MAAGMHAPTRDNPKGQLSEQAALFLGAALLYRIPPVPEDPVQDHAAILEWLSELGRSVGQARALLGRTI
jgi:hypothetical protein